MALQLRRKTHESFLFYRTVICSVSLCLAASCSIFTKEGEASRSQIDTLHEQIKSGQFERIYAESAESLRSRLSEEEFIYLMNKAVEKMKAFDETMSFQESSVNKVLPQILDNENWSSTYFAKLERNAKKLEIFSQWGKEKQTDDFKFTGLVIVQLSEAGKYEPFYV